MEIRREAVLRSDVVAAMDRLTEQLTRILPDATVDHVGATAVPEALTKGDLDLLVSVPADRFEGSLDRLKSNYSPHCPEDWTSDLASFKEEPTAELPVGIQLVVAGGRSERLFLKWRDLLRRDPELLDRYNRFKSSHAAEGYTEYTEAKADFIEQALGESLDE